MFVFIFIIFVISSGFCVKVDGEDKPLDEPHQPMIVTTIYIKYNVGI